MFVSVLQESRKLKFWYVEGTDYYNQVTTAYEFFKELVRPENFPRGKRKRVFVGVRVLLKKEKEVLCVQQTECVCDSVCVCVCVRLILC